MLHLCLPLLRQNFLTKNGSLRDRIELSSLGPSIFHHSLQRSRVSFPYVYRFHIVPQTRLFIAKLIIIYIKKRINKYIERSAVFIGVSPQCSTHTRTQNAQTCLFCIEAGSFLWMIVYLSELKIGKRCLSLIVVPLLPLTIIKLTFLLRSRDMFVWSINFVVMILRKIMRDYEIMSAIISLCYLAPR